MTFTEEEELAGIFRTEAAAIVADLGTALLSLEGEGPGGAAQAEAYRQFHTLKGMANMAGLAEVARLCHEAEAALAPGEIPRVDALLSGLDEVGRRLRQATERPAQEAGAAEPESARFVPVDTRRLDNLLNLVGELTVAETRLAYEHSNQQAPSEASLGRLSNLVRSLRDEVMRARLIPIRQLFAPIPRLVRDIAKAEGKIVRVEVDDAGLDLDRAVVDRVTGAIVHLVQNAVVHGIEPPGQRQRAGKPPQGRVAVRGRREHETTILEVEDDGGGVDLARVGRRAVEGGLIPAGAAAELTPEAAAGLLVIPGFTTSPEATGHSGRGVGLTAARDVARALGGNLLLDSRPGRGTVVSLRLPPSLAVIETLLVCARGNVLALPLRNVHRIVPASHADRVGAVAAVRHGADVLPILGVDGLAGAGSGDGFVVVARGARGAFGLAVDRVLETHAAILKPIDAALLAEGGALGATILGSGIPAIVLDLDAFGGGALR